MIGQLRGTIVKKSHSEAVIDVAGVGYSVQVSLPTSEALITKKEATLYTYLHVREDALQLYGFTAEAEKEMFMLLLSVNGIGPKAGLAVLSGIDVDRLRQAIDRSDTGLLSTIPGIGKKTAERIVLELRGKISKLGPLPAPGRETSGRMKIRSEAIVALMSLGHTRAAAEESIRTAVLSRPDEELAVEDLVRTALAEKSSLQRR